MIKDYVLYSLIEDRNFFEENNPNTTPIVTYNRRIVSYMKCLMFAICWNKLHDQVDISTSRKVYQALFKSQDSKMFISKEPGEYAKLLKTVCNEVYKREDFKDEINFLYFLGSVRNSEAHMNISLWRDENTVEVNKAISEWNKFFEDSDCDYLLPCEVRGDFYDCWMVRPAERYAVSKVQIPMNEDYECNQTLLYRIIDRKTGRISIFRIDPFIRLDVYGKNAKFWMYLYTQNNGFGTGLHRVCYESVMANDNNKFEQLESNISLSTIFPHSIIAESDRYNKWIPSPYNKMQINVSQYPGFGEIRTGGVPFCHEICKIRSKVKLFCEDLAKQVCIIYGNGGLGKTALALSIISEYYTTTDDCRYDFLIFLSAKDNYYSFNSVNLNPYQREDYKNATDIRNYFDLLNNLCSLLNLEISPDNLEESAKRIFNTITSSGKRFLLIIDDLDSIEINEQERIEEYIYRFPATSLKTILTTRKESGNSPVSFEITKLDEKQSLAFAIWYYSQSGMNWDEWQHKAQAIQAINCFGEGNPLQIKMLISLVRNGLNGSYYNINATKRERSIYLYKTVHNILTPDQKILFELCRRIYNNLPERYQDHEIRKDIARYLVAGVGIVNDRFDSAWEMLIKLMLISESNNEIFFKPYNTFVADHEIVQISSLIIPKIYRKIMRHIKSNPLAWIREVDIEDTIIDCLSELENDADYDSSIVMGIYEEIQARSKNKDAINVVSKWIEVHGIDNDSEQTSRIIEQLKVKLSVYKEALEKDLYEEVEIAQREFLKAINEAEVFAQENSKTDLSEIINQLRREARQIEDELS